MCQFLLLRLTFSLCLLSFPFSFGFRGWDDNAISLDVITDIGGLWISTHQWFEYSNTSSDLEEFIQKKYPVNSEDLDWDQFSDSIGIWGLFHEDIPPIFGIGPPSFAYGAQTPVLNVIIKYRLHGKSASIVVYNSFEERARIVYDCDQYFCEDGFHEAVIPLSDKPGTVGQFKFNLTLITENEGEFILIDSITATGVGATLPPTTTEPYPTVTDEATTTSTKTTAEDTLPPSTKSPTTLDTTSTTNSESSSVSSEETTNFVSTSTVTQTSTTTTITTTAAALSTTTTQNKTSSTLQSSSIQTTEEINEETSQWTTSSTTDFTSSTESTSTEDTNIRSTTESSGWILFPGFSCIYFVLTILFINLTK